jgi:hypothetical protein
VLYVPGKDVKMLIALLAVLWVDLAVVVVLRGCALARARV